MAKYIEVEQWCKVLAEVSHELYSQSDYEAGDIAFILRKILINRPAADVKPIIHAHWIPDKVMTKSPTAQNYRRSHCNYHSFFTNYCGECGAQMDEEEK